MHCHSTVIPATKEAEIKGITVSEQLRQKKFVRPHILTKKSWVWYCTPIIPVTVENKQDHDPGQPVQKTRHYLQNNQSKKA
jgi:hypothetical protein